MNIYTIYVPELGESIQIKVVSPAVLKAFTEDLTANDLEEYSKYVLEKFVYNLPTILRLLKKMSKESADNFLQVLYNACVMLNPGLDIDMWLNISSAKIPSPAHIDAPPPPDNENGGTKTLKSNANKTRSRTKKTDDSEPFKMTRAKLANLGSQLRSKVVGQEEAINAVESVLRRSQAGLGDQGRPLGVFVFSGASGTGKTYLAQELHKYLFGADYDMVRIDCGEFQHKHENQKLIGSPNGYIGFEEGGLLTNKVKEHPNTVILLDEVEKAHPDIWNTFLRVFDEGVLNDNKGNPVSFTNTIIILTTNLGNEKVVNSIQDRKVGFLNNTSAKNPTRSEIEREATEAIRKYFKPELINRLDKVVVFNHLSVDDLKKIAELELEYTDHKLAKLSISLNVFETAINKLISFGLDPVQGARRIKQVRRDEIESLFSDIILERRCPRGTVFDLYVDEEDNFQVDVHKPKRTKSTNESTKDIETPIDEEAE